MSKYHRLNKKKLEAKLKKLLENHSKESVWEAYKFADTLHKGQVRDGTDIPYIAHPLRMVIALIEKYNFSNTDVFKAVFLHDVLEDTTGKEQQIKERFGEEVLEIVKKVTRPRIENETPQQKFKSKTSKYKKLLRAKDKIKKLALVDLLDSMEDWLLIKKENPIYQKIPRWLKEAETLYLPLAESVGGLFEKRMKQIYNELISRGHKVASSSFKA